MLEVWNAASGQKITEFKDDEIAGASVKALKQRLAQELDISRFRLELLEGLCQLRDDQTLPPRVVQLVIQGFWPPGEQDQEIIVACRENEDTLLEKHLNKPILKMQIKSHPCMWQPPAEVSHVYFYYLKQGQKNTKSDGCWRNASFRSCSEGAP